MTSRKFKLRVMTPERTLFEGDVASVRGGAPDGEFEVFANHVPWVSPAVPSCFIVSLEHADEGRAGKVRSFAFHGGLIEVKQDSMLVLADTAEIGEEIDEERAMQSCARAEERLQSRAPESVDFERARRSFARAMKRLEAKRFKPGR